MDIEVGEPEASPEDMLTSSERSVDEWVGMREDS